MTDTRTRKQKRRDRAEGVADEGAFWGGCCLFEGCVGSLVLAGVAWRIGRLF